MWSHLSTRRKENSEREELPGKSETRGTCSTTQKSKRTVISVTNWHYKVEIFLWQIFVPVSLLHPCKKIVRIYPLWCMLPSRIDGICPHPMAFVPGHGKSAWFDLIPCVSTKCHEKSMPQNERHWSWLNPTYSLK